MDEEKGQPYGYAFYITDVFCPHQLSDWEWMVLEGTIFIGAEHALGITCK